MNLIVTTPENLAAVVRAAVKEAMAESRTPAAPVFYSKREAMELLRIGYKKLQSYIASGLITPTPQGKIPQDQILNISSPAVDA